MGVYVQFPDGSQHWDESLPDPNPNGGSVISSSSGAVIPGANRQSGPSGPGGNGPAGSQANPNGTYRAGPSQPGQTFGSRAYVTASNPITNGLTTTINGTNQTTGAQTMSGTNPLADTTGNGGGIGQGNIDTARRGILYNLQDPEFALQNALADRGISTFNPLISKGIMPAAKGLATSFTLGNALNPNVGPGYDVAGGFKDFLSQVLGGGSIQGTTQGAMSQLQSPQLSSALANAASLSNTGTTPLNPFLGGLLDLLSSPEQIPGLMSSLALPNLGSSLANSLGQLQSMNVSRAYRNVNSTAPTAFLDYLMGR